MHFIIAPRMVVSRGELQPQRCYRIEIDAQQLRSNYQTKDMMIFKKTTYRYEDGKKFAMFTFKNDELDSKEGNLQREP